MKRTVTVKLQPSKEQEKILFELAYATAVIWNRLNYQRLKQFKEFGKIDFNRTEKEAYHEFKDWIGGSTVQELARKNGEAWRSFFSLNRKKKKGELSDWFKPRPPKFVREKNGRKLFVIPLRNDQYHIKGNVIELRRLGKFGKLEVQFRGRTHLKGRQGRLEITYDPVRGKWYAHVSFTVEEKLEGEEWIKLPRTPKGSLSSGIDLGVNNLMAVYVENGESFLVNGRPLKSIPSNLLANGGGLSQTLALAGRRSVRQAGFPGADKGAHVEQHHRREQGGDGTLLHPVEYLLRGSVRGGGTRGDEVWEYTNAVHDVFHRPKKPWDWTKTPVYLFKIKEIYDNGEKAMGVRIYP